MKSHPQPTEEHIIANLNTLLRGEISAVETYDQALIHLAGEPVEDLLENRDCHSGRMMLLAAKIREHGGIPDTHSGAWGAFARVIERSASLISAHTVITALEEGEDHGLALYRNPGELNPGAKLLVEEELLPRQVKTHKRMRERKHQFA